MAATGDILSGIGDVLTGIGGGLGSAYPAIACGNDPLCRNKELYDPTKLNAGELPTYKSSSIILWTSISFLFAVSIFGLIAYLFFKTKKK